MTLVSGVVCPDGLVIAADTEVVYGDVKTYGEKLISFQRPDAELIVGGAGWGEYIDHASRKLAGVFRSMKTLTVPSLTTAIERTLLSFHEKVVFPTWCLPEADRGRVHLIVGLVLKNGHRALWKTVDSAVSEVDHFACVGSGEAVANHVGENLLHPNQCAAVAEHLLSQVVFESRLRSTGVGGTVEVWAYKTLENTRQFFNSGRDDMGYLWGLDEAVADAIWYALDRLPDHLAVKKAEISKCLDAIYEKAREPIQQYNPRKIVFRPAGQRTMVARRV